MNEKVSREEKNDITKELLHELFDYRDGELFNKTSRGNNIKVGSKAGTLSVDDREVPRIRVRVCGSLYLRQRLIYIYHHGNIPYGLQIDHGDHKTLNDRIENLTPVTGSQNSKNRGMRKDNTSGYAGVSFVKKRVNQKKPWMGSYRIDGKNFHVGYFPTAEAAHEAVEAKRKELGFHENHGKAKV